MAQTDEGISKLRQTMISKYGSEEAWKQVMRERGAIGGRNGNTGGFTDRELASRAGAIGGRISRPRQRSEA